MSVCFARTPSHQIMSATPSSPTSHGRRSRDHSRRAADSPESAVLCIMSLALYFFGGHAEAFGGFR